MATDYGPSLLSALVSRSKQVADPLAAAYASGNRPFTVRVTRPGPPSTFDRATGQMDNPADLEVYLGPARISTLSGPVELEIGDERTTMSSARISIDAGGELFPRVDDIVDVVETEQATQTHLVGRSFTVTDVEAGGHFGIGYVLSVMGIAPSRRS